MNLPILPIVYPLRRTVSSLSAIFGFTALTLGVSIALPASLQAGDWPQWRGANGEAKAAGFTAPQTWPKQLTQKWKTSVGEGVATPALVGDKLYVFSRENNNEVTRCLDAATGKEVWQDKYEVQPPNGPAAQFSGPRSSPAVADGKVVTLGVRGTLSGLDAATGKLLWRHDDFNGATPNFFTASSPMVVDGLCIAVLGGRDNGAIAGYDLTSGEQKWKWSGDGAAYASPALMTVDGTKLIVVLTEHNALALQAADGKQVWEAPFAAQGMGAYNASTPVVDGQTLFYGGSKRGMKAVKFEKEGGNVSAKDLWANTSESVQFNTPVIDDGALYGLTQDNSLFCIKAQDGQTAWTAPIAPDAAASAGGGGGGGGRGRGMRGGGFGSIVNAGPVLLALTPSSELVVFQSSDKAYTEVARLKVADTPTHAYPVAADNRIFIKDKDSVTLWTSE